MDPDQSSNPNHKGTTKRHGAGKSERSSNPLFDGIVSAAAQLCEFPIAWLTVGNGDATRVLSSVGLTLQDQPGNDVIWQLALSEPTGLIQLEDEGRAFLRSAASVPPIDQEIGFLAAQLLLGDRGQPIGLLCLYDIQQRQLTADQVNSLVRLGGIAAFLVENRQPTLTGELYSLLEGSVTCAVAVTDPNLPDQPIIFCNNEFCRLTGYDRAEILGRNCRFLQGEGTDPMITAKLERDLALGSVQSLLLKNYRKDGTEFWNDLSVSIDRDPDGGVRQYIWAAHDVTRRVSAEQDLALVDDQFEYLAEEAYIFSAETGRFLLVNEAARRSLGYSNEEILCLNTEDINPNLTAEDRRLLVLPIREGLVDVLVRRTTFQRKDGSTYPVESKLRISYFGRTEAIVCYAVDISERQSIERIIRESNGKATTESDAEKTLAVDGSSLFEALDIARQANRSKSDFLAAASHDLRQPLHSIGLGLDRLLQSQSMSEVQDITQTIRSSVDVMRDLLNALLDIGKFDTGSMTVSKQDFDLDLMLRRVVKANSLWAGEKGLPISYANCGASVYSDQALLERIVDNFVSNAIRFTNTGHVIIKTSRDTRNLRITVSDSGIGMPPESFKRIFEQYYQLYARPGSRSEGLGLGLAVVQRIAALLGHPIDVASEAGTGSEFSVDVPLSDIEEPTVTEKATVIEPERTRLQPVYVLLVEDDRLIALTTTALLETKGYEVLGASSTEQALGGIQDGFCPSIIVADYRLVGENGVDLIHEVRRVLQSDIPALVVTGDANSELIRNGLPKRCSVLYKPVDFDTLNQTVLKVLDEF